MKSSLVITVFNEEKSIGDLLKSIFAQTKLPDEIIIVDAFSKDRTLEKIKQFQEKFKNNNIRILQKKGNIATGRNEAIKKSVGEIILCTDAGCTLDKDWIKNISAPFKDPNIEIISGYYKPVTNSVFQKCLAPYTCVMPDKLNEKEFIPSSRSIAFRKIVWKKVGGYPEYLERCEDLIFAKNLKDKGFKFKFVKNAVVFWPQRKNISQAFKQFFLYAKGDGRAKYIRSQVPLIYLRYFLAIYFLFICLLERSVPGFLLFLVSLFFYFLWAIKKNYRYVNDNKALIILPVLQITADLAVLSGTTIGLLERINLEDIKNRIINNKFLILVLILYSGALLFTIKWGIPNKNNPYPYNMDEWHQFQAARSIAKFGTPNRPGSANGPMFQYLSYTIYLIPLTLLKIINPIVLEINNWQMRERIFELLRVNTIIYGILSIITFYQIAKKAKISKFLAITLFAFCPLWITLSGIFKYDIALMFWILLSLYALVRFILKPTGANYLLTAIPVSLAISSKLSALPLFPIYLISFFWFMSDRIKNIKYFILGMIFFSVNIILFAIPDTIFGKGSVLLVFYENVISGPKTTQNFNLGMNPYLYLISHHYPIIFGQGLLLLFVFSFGVLIYFFFKTGVRKSLNNNKIEIFIILSFLLFILSLIPLGIYAGINRVLVLLPFVVLICCFGWEKIKNISRLKFFVALTLAAVIFLQIYESVGWMRMRSTESPQGIASEWIVTNIPKKTEIGLENVPIYQGIPDILKKEFYYDQRGLGKENLYTYKIIDVNSKDLPKVIVITNDDYDSKMMIKSPKKDLVSRIKKEGYRKAVIIRPLKPYEMNDQDFYFSTLVPIDDSITVYIK